jgi:hypothetical protein
MPRLLCVQVVCYAPVVKVIDIPGNDTTKTVKVKVK